VSAAPLEVDVVVDPDAVLVYVREADRACTCTDEWPGPGSCHLADDVIQCSCAPAPGSCLTSVRLEQSGIVLTAVQPSPDLATWGYFQLDTPWGRAGGAQLVLDGCGGTARVSLPVQAPSAHQLTELRSNVDTLRLQWSGSTEATSSMAAISDLHNRPHCHRETGGVTDVGSDIDRRRRVWVTLRTMQSTTETTALGQVRVWNAATSRHHDVLFPAPRQDGRWDLYDRNRLDDFTPTLSLNIDGVAETRGMRPDLAAVDTAGAAPLIELADQDFGYAAGSVTDSLWLRHQGKRYTASFPHVAPTQPIALGSPGGARVSLLLGPVTMTADDSSGATITASATIDWELGAVAAPGL
jgi:hypothetical protein